MPTLSTEKTALELQYEQMREQVRIEKSKLSDFELEELDFESMKKARIKKAQEEDSNIKVRFCVARDWNLALCGAYLPLKRTT